MAKEKEIDLNDSDTSELFNDEKSEPRDTIKNVLDERDYLRPLEEAEAESLDPSWMDDSVETEARDEEEVEMPSVAKDTQAENPQAEPETEIPMADDDEQGEEESASNVEADDMPDENDDPVDDDLDIDSSDDDENALVAEDLTDIDKPDDDVAADEKNQETKTPPGDDNSEIKSQLEEKLSTEPTAASDGNDFVGLDDDATENKPSKAATSKPKKAPIKKTDDSKPEKEIVKKDKNEATSQDESLEEEGAKSTTPAPDAPKTAKRPSPANIIFSFALIVLIVAGYILYNNPTLIGLTRTTQPVTPPVSNRVDPETPVPQQGTTPSSNSNRDQCLAKLEEANRLRNELLKKKEEIYELDLYYRNGIAELEEEVYQEIKKAGISSYEGAMKNKRIELNMRTIQRRRAYIKELTKPAYWIYSGSEELYYLVRKAQLDLQLTDIAGGIDLNKHMRHISAAIHKYRPSPDKLAVDPPQSKLQPLETIWQEVRNQTGKKKQVSLNTNDELIINQICAGNFERIAELNSISPAAAKCLSQMKSSELFLNGLTALSPNAAKQLFQWQGNWIGLNGVKHLSPAVSQYLFKWKGNWISLNSLNEFPPEMALYLLKWEGQQLELMGLKYSKSEANQKTLKYLALWETTGGKLFVTDKIRKEMESLM